MLMTNHVNYVFIHQELVIPRCSSGSPHRAVQASVGADAGTLDRFTFWQKCEISTVQLV